MVGRGDGSADFLSETGLYVGILAELVAAPGQSAGGGFVLFAESVWGKSGRSKDDRLTPAAKKVNI